MDEPTVSITFTANSGNGLPEPREYGFAVPARVRPYLLILGFLVVSLCLSTGISPQPTPSPAATDIDSAETTFVTCMSAWNLPITIWSPYMGTSSMGLSEVGHTAVWRDPYGQINWMTSSPGSDGGDMYSFGTGTSGADDELYAQELVIGKFHEGPAMFIDGMDYSHQYTQCLDETGYAPGPAAQEGDRMPLPSQMEWYAFVVQAQVRANDLWARCARGQGWAVPDSTSPTGDSFEAPQTTIPSTMTEEQLRTLLDACPDFDPATIERLAAWMSVHADTSITYYPDYLPDPNIGIRIVGFDAAFPAEWMPPAQETALIRHVAVLRHILDEQRDEYDAFRQEV